MDNIILPAERLYEDYLKKGCHEMARAIRETHSQFSDLMKKKSYDLLVGLTATHLENYSCGKASMPCKSCVTIARIIATSLWAVQFQFIDKILKAGGHTDTELFEMYCSIVEDVRKDILKVYDGEDILAIERPSKGAR